MAAVIGAPRSFPRILAESNLNLNQRGLCRIHVHGITAALEAEAASRGRVARGPCLWPGGSADRNQTAPPTLVALPGVCVKLAGLLSRPVELRASKEAGQPEPRRVGRGSLLQRALPPRKSSRLTPGVDPPGSQPGVAVLKPQVCMNVVFSTSLALPDRPEMLGVGRTRRRGSAGVRV